MAENAAAGVEAALTSKVVGTSASRKVASKAVPASKAVAVAASTVVAQRDLRAARRLHGRTPGFEITNTKYRQAVCSTPRSTTTCLPARRRKVIHKRSSCCCCCSGCCTNHVSFYTFGSIRDRLHHAAKELYRSRGPPVSRISKSE